MPNKAATTTAAAMDTILPSFGRLGRAWTPVPTPSVADWCGAGAPARENADAETAPDDRATDPPAELGSAGAMDRALSELEDSAPTLGWTGETPVSPLSNLTARLESVSRFRRISSDFISEACW